MRSGLASVGKSPFTVRYSFQFCAGLALTQKWTTLTPVWWTTQKDEVSVNAQPGCTRLINRPCSGSGGFPVKDLFTIQ